MLSGSKGIRVRITVVIDTSMGGASAGAVKYFVIQKRRDKQPAARPFQIDSRQLIFQRLEDVTTMAAEMSVVVVVDNLS